MIKVLLIVPLPKYKQIVTENCQFLIRNHKFCMYSFRLVSQEWPLVHKKT